MKQKEKSDNVQRQEVMRQQFLNLGILVVLILMGMFCAHLICQTKPFRDYLVQQWGLQQDFRVSYNPERIQSPDFSDASDLFLNGLLTGKRQGTCVSMPVLYVAVGRRLGYPLKLVSSKAHLFARWESPDDKERFNIEATNQGLNCFPDDYYHTWPVTLTDDEINRGEYLKSLNPAEELAVFLSTRGHCLEAAGRLAEAQVAYAHAHALAPSSSVYLAFLAGAVKKEMPQWERVRVDLGGRAAAK